jgi:FKBP-type peptidyl-prolyl cis-trans isomerase (trigger factor)
MDEQISEVSRASTPATETPAGVTPPTHSKLPIYFATGAVVLLIVVGLWFMLVKQGRLTTGAFSVPLSYLKEHQAAAVVNGVEVSVSDFESTLRQLTVNVEQQGVDTTDDAIVADLRNQAIDSLVNTEVLRQVAEAGGATASEEDITTRYQQIAQSLGGEEGLKSKMQELGVSEDMLRRDIRNDILIQAHLEKAVDLSSITVSEEEIEAFYNEATASLEDAPALSEVREQVEQQIRFGKEQELVAAYVASVREQATVEVKV